MDVPRRHWKNLDWPMLLAVFALIGIGLITIYSATFSRVGTDPFYLVKRQLVGVGIGVIALSLVVLLDYRVFGRWAKILYLGSGSLLILVLTLGRTVFGSQRWIRLGPLNLQPSEVAKLAIIIALARYLEEEENYQGIKILIPFALIGVPMFLILRQPDMGTSLVFVGILFSMLYLRGACIKSLGSIALGGFAVAFLAAWLSFQEWMPFQLIKPYQLNRLLVFLDPYSDPTGSGWNVIQSMIAVGSGGFLGKGLFGGTQNQLSFLPANHTDFVFSVITEEMGFVGGVLVLVLYLFILWRGLNIALVAKDEFGMCLVYGCIGMFFCHLVINVGMTIGIMPVTGLPLPFITYGGSTMLTSLIAIGFMLNVGLRRKKIMF